MLNGLVSNFLSSETPSTAIRPINDKTTIVDVILSYILISEILENVQKCLRIKEMGVYKHYPECTCLKQSSTLYSILMIYYTHLKTLEVNFNSEMRVFLVFFLLIHITCKCILICI
jgi:hypothetical protein